MQRQETKTRQGLPLCLGNPQVPEKNECSLEDKCSASYFYFKKGYNTLSLCSRVSLQRIFLNFKIKEFDMSFGKF